MIVAVAPDTSEAMLAIRADIADVRPASLWLETRGNERAIPSEQIFRLDLCLNEALANVLEHGGSEAARAPVTISLQSTQDGGSGQAILTISDAGRAFDTQAASPKAQAASLAEATPGGLGLRLMSSFADEVNYAYRQNRNCLQFIVRWPNGK